MENIVWIIYLIDVVCDGFDDIGFIVFFVTTMSFTAFVCSKFDESIEEVVEKLPIKTVVILGSTLLLLGSLIPTKDTAYKMLAAYGVNEVYQSEDAQNLLGDGMDILKMTLADYKEEMEKGKN